MAKQCKYSFESGNLQHHSIFSEKHDFAKRKKIHGQTVHGNMMQLIHSSNQDFYVFFCQNFGQNKNRINNDLLFF